MSEFRGRIAELDILQKKFDTDGFQMIVIYGRRRIGKTELMNEFMRRQKCKTVSFTAVEQSEKDLLSIMTETVLASLAPELMDMVSFPDFEKLFEFIGKKAKEERIVFFIDEYPYLAKADKSISSRLQHIIDHTWKNGKLFLILCGSSMSFMEYQVLGYESPLYGRRTTLSN